MPIDPEGPAPNAAAAPELDRLVASLHGVADPSIHAATAAAAESWRRPLRIRITGRARAGKSTLTRGLALISALETAPVDEPGTPDPDLGDDLVVYVLAGAPQPADRRILGELPPERVLAVLNKADAIGARWSDAVAAAEQYGRELGIPVLPVVAELAAHTRAGLLSDDDLRTLRRHRDRAGTAFTLSPELFTAATAGADTADRQAVLDRWGLYGVAVTLIALRHDPATEPRVLLQLLHAASGIDAVHLHLHRRYERLADRRGGDLLDELTRLAARAVPPDHRSRDLIEDYLVGPEARWLGLRAGQAHPDVAHLAAGYPATGPADPDDALARARRWRAVASGDLPAPARRAALRVHHAYIQLWEQLSRAGL
ncbi:hypothetical protein [Nocardia sp. alder85J]|uniref:hypothetical protein n=1 Tax=Nocardia sp. alder85J TaxID=2862949 RepID=UPI001CD71E8A|nr:hypothetical protein [Nocardia sp. alder85J]MCX4096325.1 hypothetical protein [Nocardia sp. alder85J]